MDNYNFLIDIPFPNQYVFALYIRLGESKNAVYQISPEAFSEFITDINEHFDIDVQLMECPDCHQEVYIYLIDDVPFGRAYQPK